jgi:type IV secretory pathway component VirB8
VTKDNALKAESEIKKAEKISRNSSRKMLWLVTLLCILAVSIITLVIFIFLPNENKDKKFLM